MSAPGHLVSGAVVVSVDLQPSAGRLWQTGQRHHETVWAKKQGAAGITTAAPYVTGQWGRGE